jgi:hypothetical protein
VGVQVTICYFQFTDLEEEFVEFRQKIEIEQAEKEQEIARLREQLKTVEQQHKHTGSNAGRFSV